MRKVAALLVLVCVPILLVSAGAVRAGTPACTGTKIDPVASGTYAVPFGSELGSITIAVRPTSAGTVFDFQTDSTTHLVTTVAVKGGPVDPVLYILNASSGTGLHSVLNPSSGKWYGLSYLCFETTTDGGGGGE
jgi:hypothetical protein